MLKKSILLSVSTISSVEKCFPPRFTFFSRYLYIRSERKQVRKWALMKRLTLKRMLTAILLIKKAATVLHLVMLPAINVG